MHSLLPMSPATSGQAMCVASPVTKLQQIFMYPWRRQEVGTTKNKRFQFCVRQNLRKSYWPALILEKNSSPQYSKKLKLGSIMKAETFRMHLELSVNIDVARVIFTLCMMYLLLWV